MRGYRFKGAVCKDFSKEQQRLQYGHNVKKEEYWRRVKDVKVSCCRDVHLRTPRPSSWFPRREKSATCLKCKKKKQRGLFYVCPIKLMTFHLKCKIFKYFDSMVGLLLLQERYLSTPPPQISIKLWTSWRAFPKNLVLSCHLKKCTFYVSWILFEADSQWATVDTNVKTGRVFRFF